MLWTRITIGMLTGIQVLLYVSLIYEVIGKSIVRPHTVAMILATAVVIAGLQLLDAHLQ